MTITKTSSPPLIWAISDDRPGNRTQTLGVAEKLGLEYEEKNISYNKRANLPNSLLGASLLGVDKAGSSTIAPPWPDVVIAAGRRLIPLMRHIKKRNPKCFSCYLMHPQSSLTQFDLLAIPQHDEPPPADNIIATLGTPHRLTPQLLAEEAANWQDKFSHLPEPRIALLMGGDSPGGRFADDDWYQLAYHSSKLAERAGGSLLVTTSRRTSARAVNIVRLALTEPHLLHHWQPQGENPYLAMLGSADAIIVTGESMSMCSEACASGKPVFIYSSQTSSSEKHKLLHEELYAHGYARPLDASSDPDWNPPAALDEAARIATAIRERLNC